MIHPAVPDYVLSAFHRRGVAWREYENAVRYAHFEHLDDPTAFYDAMLKKAQEAEDTAHAAYAKWIESVK